MHPRSVEYIPIQSNNVGEIVGRKVGRTLHKLSATQVDKLKEPGYYGDGGGLWLQISASLSKSWIYRFTIAGKAREMGLGPKHTITLAEARDKALACRKLVLEGVDPIEHRKASRLTQIAAAARVLTFKQCAEAYIEAHRAGWKSTKHADQWASTLEAYAYPVLGGLSVAAIDVALVLKVLEPHWSTKTETASRLRGRMELVLDWATARQYRQGENPARWRGHLDKLLPRPSKVAKVVNFAALPYLQVGEFMQTLRAEKGVAALVLEFIILTAVRTSEALEATWTEFDLPAKTWTIPAERMKGGREHRVPLSTTAVAVLKRMEEVKESAFVFPGAREGKPLSNMACLMLLKRMKRTDITVHGFRSSFRDWAAEQTNYPREVAEMALAHAISDSTEAAYRRGDLFNKRAKLMQAWADYCGRAQTGAAVTPIHARKA